MRYRVPVSINAARKRRRRQGVPRHLIALERAADAAELERLLVVYPLVPRTAESARVILAECGLERAAAFVIRNHRKAWN